MDFGLETLDLIMDALILAGGEVSPDLASTVLTGGKERALIEINGRPMVAYVLDALRVTAGVERIAVVGPEDVLRIVKALEPDVVTMPQGEGMMDNVLIGMTALNWPPLALISTCDIPLVSAATFEQMMARREERQLEAVYPIVRRETCEAAFPGGKRTYGTVREGAFTAGNAVVVPGPVVKNLIGFFNAMYQVRKNPIGMARLLGAGFLLKTLTKRLTIAEAERKMSGIVGCRAGAIEMHDATIAFDVDKLEDYKVAQQALEKRVRS
ncbi:MAG: nucleotidyltransferase family protein [Armatimonadota bacterium]|nr:nucleotidyltransferase family protein [Armatimonadota bacterium]